MLGGGSDGAHEARVSGESCSIFLQFAGKWRAWPVVLVYRSQQPLGDGRIGRRRPVTLVAVHPAAQIAGRAGRKQEHC